MFYFSKIFRETIKLQPGKLVQDPVSRTGEFPQLAQQLLLVIELKQMALCNA
jgi:hypothetical protein